MILANSARAATKKSIDRRFEDKLSNNKVLLVCCIHIEKSPLNWLLYAS